MTGRHTWLQLLRAPNLFTVPGDPLAGFLLASFGVPGWQMLAAMLASLCLYGAGLLDNDLADFEEDQRERPSRPLPSGAAQRSTVRWVAFLLVVCGLALCWSCGLRAFWAGAAVVVAIGTYNRGSKHLPVLGALNMGACRGLSLLIGAAAAPSQVLSSEVFTAAVLVALYIAAVTNLARHETRATVPRSAKLWPAIVLFAGLGAVHAWERMGLASGAALGEVGMRFLLALAAGLAAWIAWQLIQNAKAPVPPAIGRLIRLLLPVQAAFCVHTGSITGIAPGVVLLLLWPVSRAVSRRFYAS